ncbi:AraC family transcriptional regulator [Curtobacterium sp. BRB10]|uniref:AraC family transcriptional regulator n=1 Tax=Curtobacterium sp. BRB10 TaxID=2962579 RepID=UPI00288127D4|nr:AraC family transcriptional regulator [Curtobacterium sp. BRB10]MDT0234855.1 AraC family transcriptional regulator [Curtobacterium sp. BRB10]
MLIEDGFPGQRLRVLPARRVRQALTQPGIAHLVVTDAGYFPTAQAHGKERPAGTPQCVVLVCVLGAGRVRVDGAVHEVKRGQVVVLPPNVPHAYEADQADPWTLWWVHVLGRDLEEFLRQSGMTAAQPVRHLRDVYRPVSLIEEIVGAMEHGDTDASLLAASGAAWHLMAQLCAEQVAGATALPVVDAARDYIVAHPAEPMTVAQLAAMARMSPSHFAAQFRKRVGVSPLRFQTQVRMGRASELLLTTANSVEAIARAVGYDDPFYFSRVFRSVHDVAPTVYRERARD